VITTFKEIFLRDLLAVRKEVSSFKDEALLWEIMPSTTNSAGHLCLHLVGNLNHFIGAGLGKTGYTRNRDLEFTSSPISREAVLMRIYDCLEMLEKVFANLDDSVLSKDFPLPWRAEEYYNTHFMLVQLAAHLNYHLGQVNYCRRYFC